MQIRISEETLPDYILNTKICALRSKHVGKIRASEKSENYFLEAKKIGYEWVQWGAHSRNTSLDYHVKRIIQMDHDHFYKPIRIVLCRYHFSPETVIWIDNLHSILHYLFTWGMSLQLNDIPFYCIDITNQEDIKLYSHLGGLSNQREDILGAVKAAFERFGRSNSYDLLAVNYTISDLIQDNDLDILYKKLSLQELTK